ncbi:hypothetical protein SPHINGOT1_120022 [Sphingomonas sp. T1]|nr:hypothetical protein SPHINGOT1_120022 [Sphingomonas sp. T1]
MSRCPQAADRLIMSVVVVTPSGFEPLAPRLGIWCSIRLSYGATHATSILAPFPSVQTARVRRRKRL